MQRFDELGMTHSRCIDMSHESLLSHPTWMDPCGIEGESCCEHQDSNNLWEGNPDIDDINEIHMEEHLLEEQLERDCQIQLTLHESASEIRWIKTLARRSIMMEEALQVTDEQKSDFYSQCETDDDPTHLGRLKVTQPIGRRWT